MPKKFGKVLMTNHLKFRIGNIWPWLSNFCHGFSNPLGTFSSKKESLWKRENVLRIGGKKVRKKWQPD